MIKIFFIQFFDQRSQYVKDTEKKYRLQLSSACMSEESTAEDKNGDKCIQRHPPQWRSAGMSKVAVAITGSHMSSFLPHTDLSALVA